MPDNFAPACLAPPLSDAKLAEYRAIIDKVAPRSALRDSLEMLYAAVMAWWALPEPKGTDTRILKMGHLTGPTGDPAPNPTQTLMHADHVKTLWDLVPWQYELDSMESLFDPVEQDAANKNAELESAWRNSVEIHLFKVQFPGQDRDEFLEAFNVAKATVGKLKDNRSSISERARGLLQGHINEVTPKLAEWQKSVRAAIHPEGKPPIPRPEKLPAPLRDCAWSLFWHCAELTRDREPLTTDKL